MAESIAIVTKDTQKAEEKKALPKSEKKTNKLSSE